MVEPMNDHHRIGLTRSGNMDCLENENVCSVKKENNLGYYRIHTMWNENGFRVNIASRDGAWTGEMKPENVLSMSKELKVDPEKYIAECKDVLTTDDGKKGYFYSVENGSFTWKKMIDEDSGMKIRMGSVMVQPVSFVDTIQNIIEVALNCKKNLNKQLNFLKQEKEKDMQRISQLETKLEELCDKKNLMETDLYSKFLALLNSKKRKIQELENCGIEVKRSPEKCIDSKSRKKNKVEEKDIEKAYEMDTEDEDDFVEKGNLGLSCKLSHDSGKGNMSGDIRDEGSCVTTECEEINGADVCLESDENSGESTPGFDVKAGNGPFPGTINANISSSNISPGSESVTDRSKSFPATKADILDFFFGPNG